MRDLPFTIENQGIQPFQQGVNAGVSLRSLAMQEQAQNRILEEAQYEMAKKRAADSAKKEMLNQVVGRLSGSQADTTPFTTGMNPSAAEALESRDAANQKQKAEDYLRLAFSIGQKSPESLPALMEIIGNVPEVKAYRAQEALKALRAKNALEAEGAGWKTGAEQKAKYPYEKGMESHKSLRRMAEEEQKQDFQMGAKVFDVLTREGKNADLQKIKYKDEAGVETEMLFDATQGMEVGHYDAKGTWQQNPTWTGKKELGTVYDALVRSTKQAHPDWNDKQAVDYVEGLRKNPDQAKAHVNDTMAWEQYKKKSGQLISYDDFLKSKPQKATAVTATSSTPQSLMPGLNLTAQSPEESLRSKVAALQLVRRPEINLQERTGEMNQFVTQATSSPINPLVELAKLPGADATGYSTPGSGIANTDMMPMDLPALFPTASSTALGFLNSYMPPTKATGVAGNRFPIPNTPKNQSGAFAATLPAQGTLIRSNVSQAPSVVRRPIQPPVSLGGEQVEDDELRRLEQYQDYLRLRWQQDQKDNSLDG